MPPREHRFDASEPEAWRMRAAFDAKDSRGLAFGCDELNAKHQID
jgi:hypothetical protein